MCKTASSISVRGGCSIRTLQITTQVSKILLSYQLFANHNHMLKWPYFYIPLSSGSILIKRFLKRFDRSQEIGVGEPIHEGKLKAYIHISYSTDSSSTIQLTISYRQSGLPQRSDQVSARGMEKPTRSRLQKAQTSGKQKRQLHIFFLHHFFTNSHNSFFHLQISYRSSIAPSPRSIGAKTNKIQLASGLRTRWAFFFTHTHTSLSLSIV